jgi:hypothetical protein
VRSARRNGEARSSNVALHEVLQEEPIRTGGGICHREGDVVADGMDVQERQIASPNRDEMAHGAEVRSDLHGRAVALDGKSKEACSVIVL